MTDDDLVIIRELFEAGDHSLDDATAARLLDGLDARLAVVARVPDGPPAAPAAPAARRRHRAASHWAAGAVAVAMVVGLVLLLPAGRPPRSAISPAARHLATPSTPVTKAPPFVVTGYTVSQAQLTTSQCLSVAHASDQKDAALRATFTDTLGSLLVVTTPTGFYTCTESAGGTMTGGQFETYAHIPPPLPGSPAAQVVPGDPSAHWLLGPVELDDAGGGYPSKAQTNIWVTTALGRVAPNVAKVVVQLPGQPAVTATVENGFFVARQSFATPPPMAQGPETIPLFGYSRSGALVYDSLTRPTAIAPGTPGTRVLERPPPCWVTPSGQAVTPASPGEHCQTAIAWGY